MDLVDHAGGGVAQPLQGGAQKRGAAVALAGGLVLGGDRQPGAGDPLAQRSGSPRRCRGPGSLARRPRVRGDARLGHAHPSASSEQRPRRAPSSRATVEAGA